MANSTGQVTDGYTYDAFGVELGSVGSTPNVYRYRGEQTDPSLGLQYLRARYYATRTGRFLSVDPVEGWLKDPLSRNHYLYSHSSPSSKSDPSGKFAIPRNGGEISAGLIILSILTTIYAGVQLNTFVGNLSQNNNDLERILYRGTSFYDAAEIVAQQRIPIERIIYWQDRTGRSLDRRGVFFTSQLFNAEYFADVTFGQGISGGPAVIGARVRESDFNRLVFIFSIPVEVPMPQQPLPGAIMTETMIPFPAMEEFERISTYFLM